MARGYVCAVALKLAKVAQKGKIIISETRFGSIGRSIFNQFAKWKINWSNV
jgi:hypothetical protein